MKQFNFLSLSVVSVLLIALVSCTPMRDATGYEDRRSSNYYYDDPYYGNTIILERDPYTGQLYRVSPNGAYAPYSAYGNRYNRPYNRGGARYYRQAPTYRQAPVHNNRGSENRQPTAQEKRSADNAKDVFLGKKGN